MTVYIIMLWFEEYRSLNSEWDNSLTLLILFYQNHFLHIVSSISVAIYWVYLTVNQVTDNISMRVAKFTWILHSHLLHLSIPSQTLSCNLLQINYLRLFPSGISVLLSALNTLWLLTLFLAVSPTHTLIVICQNLVFKC